MSFIELANERYSCRKFASKVVEQEKLDIIIEAALTAPTAVNFQPFKIWEIKTQEALAKVTQVTPFTFDAPVILAVGADKTQGYVRKFDNKNFAEIDASIVATHIMLEVQDLGLGTTWVGHFKPEELANLFPEMKNYDIVALFPIGYPSEDAQPSEKHYESKSKAELVTIL